MAKKKNTTIAANKPQPRRLRSKQPDIEQKSAIFLEPGEMIYWDNRRAVVREEPVERQGEGESLRTVAHLVISFLTPKGAPQWNSHSITVPSTRRFIIIERIEL